MLRLSTRSRSRIKKNKHSKSLEKNTQEKIKYEEDYNEIILNDLVLEEHREELGLDNKTNQKKHSGTKLNFSLGGKNRPNKKHNHNKNQQQDVLDEIESINNKEDLSEKIVETSKINQSQRPKKRPNNKNSNVNKKQNNENKEHNSNHKVNQNNESENKKHNSKKSHQQNSLEKKHKKIKKSENHTNESTHNSYEKTKNSSQKSTNPKKRKRPYTNKEKLQDEARNLDDVESKVETDIKGDSQDIITFRGNENTLENNNEQYHKKASEIKEVHGKFEKIVWSEDKFPKK